MAALTSPDLPHSVAGLARPKPPVPGSWLNVERRPLEPGHGGGEFHVPTKLRFEIGVALSKFSQHGAQTGPRLSRGIDQAAFDGAVVALLDPADLSQDGRLLAFDLHGSETTICGGAFQCPLMALGRAAWQP